MLEQRSQTRIADVTAQSPNVLLQVNPAGGGNSMRAYIRGVGQGDQSPAVDPGVGIYVDDVYFASITGSIFELLDLERVEILRGPQGTLNGMNSLGGSVKLFSRKPDGTGGYVEATVGDFNRREVRASGDFTLVEDKLFARVSGLSRQRDGYVTRLDYACMHPDDPYVVSGAIPRMNSGTDCKIGTLGGISLGAVRGSLRWIASDAVEVNVIADATRDKSETQPSVLREAGEIIPGLSLSYQGVPYDNRFVYDQVSQEICFNGNALGSLLEYTVGGIYFDQRTTYATREFDPFVPQGPDPANHPIFDFIQRDTTNNETRAAFVHSIWHLTDRMNFAAGVRYTKQDKDYTFYRFNIDGVNPYQPLSDPANPLNGRVGRFEGSHVDYRVNLDYQWTPDVMTYIQFSTGFKGGGISPRPYFPEQIRGFGPEELEAYEFGFKTRWFQRRLQVNGALFYNDYLNYQATPTQCVDENGEILPPPFGTPNLCGQYLNVADARVKGAELELELFPIDGLMIDAAYSYLDFVFGTPFIETSSVIAGRSAPGLGKNKWSIGGQYEWNFANGSSIVPRIDVTNLTDELYDLNKLNTVYASSQPGAPRMWAISIRKSF